MERHLPAATLEHKRIIRPETDPEGRLPAMVCDAGASRSVAAGAGQSRPEYPWQGFL